MRKMRAIIVDDEPKAVAILQMLLADVDWMEVAGTANNVARGKALIREVEPDLAFLDIQMPDGQGFELAEMLQHASTQIIFVTAYAEYAVKAFEFAALHYLLKPITDTKLEQALQRIQQEKDEGNVTKVEALRSNLSEKPEDHKIVLSTMESVSAVAIRDIVRLESSGNYCTFRLVDGRQILVSKGLHAWDPMLAGQGFFRSHQSHMVNLVHVKSLEKTDGGYILMRNGDQVPLSRRKKGEFVEVWK